MALQQVFHVGTILNGDGTSTSFSFNLQKDLYTLNAATTIQNWKQQIPSAVFTGQTGQSVSLSGAVITVTFDTAPAAGSQVNVDVGLLY